MRLTLTSSLASALILLVVFYGAYRFAEQSETRAAQSSLFPISELLSRDVEHGEPDIAEAREADPRVGVTVFKNGQFWGSSGRAVPDMAGTGVAELSGGPFAYKVVQKGPWKFVAVTRFAGSRASLDRVRLILAALFLPIVFLIGASTYFAARLTFRPLAHLAEQAERFSGEDLGKRLGVQDDAEFGMLAQQLNGLLERVQAGALRQEQFVADAAHELRTPLTVLQGNIETALSKERESSEYVATLEVSLWEAKRLASLTDALLESARAKLAEAPPLDLESAINEIGAQWLDNFVRQKVDLQLQTERIYAAITHEELACVLGNLLDNALRHSPIGTVCTLELLAIDQCARITVSDQGEGIPADARSEVFERFFQVDRARRPEGFGIGLSICQRIIRGRGGELEVVESAVGTSLRVSLPCIPCDVS